MLYKLENVNIQASTTEIAALKTALALIVWGRGETEARALIKSLKEIQVKEFQELADELAKFGPENASILTDC